MIFIPIWITNLLLLFACGFSSYQHSRLNRENPIATLQFGIIVFSIIMIVVVVVFTRFHHNAWASLAFFVIAAATFFLSYRQFRMLPPSKVFE